MPSVETEIWLALKKRVESLPLMPMPIAWPGRNYIPVSGVQFLSVSEVTIAPRRIIINRSINDRSGTITIVAVQGFDQDPSAYKETGGIIAKHFASDVCLRYGSVRLHLMSEGGNTVHVDAGYRDGGWFHTPVIIPWRTWT